MSPDPNGLRVARAVSMWHLGHPGWADRLIDAYLNPDEAEVDLAEEKKAEEDPEEAAS